MSFQRKSDLKLHLSTKSGDHSHLAESTPTEDTRVVLRDGNLITLPAAVVREETVTTPVLDKA